MNNIVRYDVQKPFAEKRQPSMLHVFLKGAVYALSPSNVNSQLEIIIIFYVFFIFTHI